ncbi:transcriptional regulator [Halobacteriales archaeon QS_4_70_19]|nr:MAG: transcriptional regulator [Halobacteriales archaeon QS_4_70_19]
MSADDTSEEADLTEGEEVTVQDAGEGQPPSFDDGIVDLLSWILDTETRARIYLYLRQHPDSTSEEIATGTGLYPSTVREALAELHEEGKVERGKRESGGAGNNPYEYTTQPPSELVASIVDGVQDGLNTVFNLDRHLGQAEADDERGPVTITVEFEEPEADADDD